MLKVEADNEKFGCWIEAPDGTRTHMTTKSMQALMMDLEMCWLEFFSHGFDGVLRDDD